MSNTLFNYFKKKDDGTPAKTETKTPSTPVLKESNRTPGRQIEPKEKSVKREVKKEIKMETDDENDVKMSTKIKSANVKRVHILFIAHCPLI